MRLAFSNIAWDVTEDEAVAALLTRYQVDAIDIAPGKYFPNPAQATDEEIFRVKSWWRSRNIEITGMQSLLFGTQGLNLFNQGESATAMSNHLEAIFRIAEKLDAPRLVFGSPANRNRQGLNDEQVKDVAVTFFRDLGERAQKHGVTVCLEPNPECYGANFMTSSLETANVVRWINHPAIKMQLDTGAATINNEDLDAVINEASDLIGHIHLSEPNLVPVGLSSSPHENYSHAINRTLKHHLATVEMVATRDIPHLESIENALTHVVNTYRFSGAVS